MKFQLFLLAVCCGICLPFNSAQTNSPTYMFETFMEASIKEYPNWLRSNYLDPTGANPTESLVINATGIVLRYILTTKDDQMIGYADSANKQTVTVDVDLKKQYIHLKLNTNGSMKFQGKYNVSGTTYPAEPFGGEGRFTYTVENSALSENITYRFNIQSNGFIGISENKREYSAKFSKFGKKNVTFDGALANVSSLDYERVRTDFIEEYEVVRISNVYPEHPAAGLLHRYLSALFQKTLYSEIIGITKPVTQTPPTQETPSTTEVNGNSDGTNIRSSAAAVSSAVLVLTCLLRR